jgi:hypothetical protein
VANTLSTVIPQLLAQGVKVLRQNAVMPYLVNRELETIAGDKGSTIDVPTPPVVAVQDVTPSNTPPATADITPGKVQVQLNQWKEAPFYLTDKDMLEAMNGTIPMTASAAVKSLANQVDQDLLSCYKDFYSFAGVPGTTPFAADLSEFLAGRAKLNKELADLSDRRVVLGVDAEANALKNRAIQDASWRQQTQGVIEAQIGRTLGADWFMDQNVPTHNSTPLTAGAATANGVQAIAAGSTDNGDTGTFSIAKATNTSQLVRGDILNVAGDTQDYVVTADTLLAVGNTAVPIAPALRKATAGGEAVSLKASHVANIVFNKYAIALASRPFNGADPMSLGKFMFVPDPVTGLVLRLEVSREHKRTRFAYDILYGFKTVRRALGARIAG